MIEYIEADLMASNCVVIAHGCNTRGAFNAGVAKLVRDNFPRAASLYEAAVNLQDFFLGSAQLCPIAPNRPECMTRYVYNLGTQLDPGIAGATGPWAVQLAFSNMLEQCKYFGIKEVGIPRIGMGIAKQKWETVEARIKQAQSDTSTMTSIRILVHDLPNTTNTERR